MTQIVPVERLRFGQTARRDAWWLQPLSVAIGLATGFGYLGWAMFQPVYWYGPYLSPVGAPPLFGNSPFSWFGAPPAFWPSFLPWQMMILWGPLMFRLSCYYYRGAYYKAFWLNPAACAVGKPHDSYSGERAFPLILQNLHRYFFYIAFLFIFLLSEDVLLAFRFPGPGAGHEEFGIGVGTVIMAANVILIGCYTFGCHSFRHLVGGRLDVFSTAPVRRKAWECATCLNKRHMMWAWLSLFSMCGTDLYIRLCAMGVISDIRIV